MKNEEMERLLALFYEGKTDEQEEELLKQAFRTEEVPVWLQEDKELFLALFCEAAEAVPAGLEDRLSRRIDKRAVEEQRFFVRKKNRHNRWRIAGIAATLLLLVGIGYRVLNIGGDTRSPALRDTFTNPEMAYKVLQATLLEVSINLNKGIEQVEETQQDMAEVSQEVRREIQR